MFVPIFVRMQRRVGVGVPPKKIHVGRVGVSWWRQDQRRVLGNKDVLTAPSLGRMGTFGCLKKQCLMLLHKAFSRTNDGGMSYFVGCSSTKVLCWPMMR